MQFIIEDTLANQILEYLSAQPYIEVVDMIDGIRKLKQVEK